MGGQQYAPFSMRGCLIVTVVRVVRRVTSATRFPVGGGYLSAADFGASNSVEHASTSPELGYDSPGRVTRSLGNSSRRFQDSAFDRAACFASASGSARNL